MSLFYTNETNTLKNHKEKVGDIMTSLKSFNRRVGSLFAVAGILLATITPGLVPAFASAAQVTERSVQLSSSSADASDVSYNVTFTPVSTAGAFAIEFCSNSALIGDECDAPAGLSVASAESGTDGFTVAETTYGAAHDHNALAVTGSLVAGTNSVQIDKIHNPSDPGTVYARIVTYASDATGYQSATLGSGAQDQGSAAFSITNTVGVSGLVNETMTFCVAGNVIDQANCTTTDNGGTLKAPTLKLGQGTAPNVALDSTHVSTGNVYTQLSTNAAGGAVVSLKSANACGGLKRAEADADVCDIAATTDGTGITQGQARFGVEIAPGDDPTGASGTLQIAGGGSAYYSDSIFKLNYVAGGASGVTSAFGDKVLDTDNGPVNNKNAQVTFGASIANNTPAGLYSNDYSLIATGKY